MKTSNLHLLAQNINAEVLRGMNQNSSRSLDLVERRLPRFLHSLGRDFAGTKGSRIYKGLHSGEVSYRSYCFEKPVINKPFRYKPAARIDSLSP